MRGRFRPVPAAAAALVLVTSACAADGADRADVSAGARESSSETQPTATPATTLPATTTSTVAPATTATTAPTTTTTILEETEPVAGPGVEHQVLMASLATLIEAENAMHAFEADWDAGMTYSETFQGWREVRAIVDDAFASFGFPEEASAEQLAVGQVYVDAVWGAQVEWQNVTDFIVTYITNYTPEVLIQGAYTKAEFRLRDAIAALEAIEALGTA